jgi:hypothetical protein
MKSGSREVQQNLFCNFRTFLQVSTNFGILKQFMEFKTIENELKFTAQCRAEIRPSATVHGPVACHARPARWPAGPWPDGLTQPWRRPARGTARWCARRQLDDG